MAQVAGNTRALEAVFRAADVGIVVADATGTLVAVNPAADRIIGWHEVDSIGRRFSELTHPDDAAAGEAMFAALLARELPSYELERRYGGACVRITVSLDAEPDAPLAIALLEDVTQRNALAHASAERLKELTALHEATRVMLDTTTPRDDRLAAIAALLVPAMQHPELATACIRVGSARFATPGHRETACMLTAPFRTAAGDDGAVEVSYREPRAFLDEEQTLLHSLVEIVRGALDRDAAEHELRSSSERLNLALTVAGMAVWEWNLETDQICWSRQLAEMTGVTAPPSSRFGEHLHLVHEDDRAALADAARKLAEHGGAVEALDVRIRRADGTWRPMQVFAHRAFDNRVLAVFVDVTVRQTLEAALRTAQKLEGLGQVAGGVAHDFNNLLMVIVAGVSMLRGEVHGEDLRHVADEVHEAAMRAVRLTRQLLQFSRHKKFEPSVVAVNATIRSLEPMLVRLTREVARLELQLDEHAGTVWADATQIEQIVMNLVVNARDAIGSDGVIHISTSSALLGDPVRRFVVIGVRDNGPGITQELQTRIFEPFFTTKELGKGTGLGLAVVTNVARQWGGHVTLDSAPGAGASFRVFLPRHEP